MIREQHILYSLGSDRDVLVAVLSPLRQFTDLLGGEKWHANTFQYVQLAFHQRDCSALVGKLWMGDLDSNLRMLMNWFFGWEFDSLRLCNSVRMSCINVRRFVKYTVILQYFVYLIPWSNFQYHPLLGGIPAVKTYYPKINSCFCCNSQVNSTSGSLATPLH